MLRHAAPALPARGAAQTQHGDDDSGEQYGDADRRGGSSGGVATAQRAASLHTSRNQQSIRVSGDSDPTACFAAPRTSTGTPGGDGASHPAPEG